MPVSVLRLVRRCFEFARQEDYAKVPAGTRGVYVLYNARPSPAGPNEDDQRFDVVYIGLAAEGEGGIRRRLRSHKKTKEGEWTHFSVYEVWDNIRDDEIAELEGLFRHIYRFDSHANRLNQAKSYLRLNQVRRGTQDELMPGVASYRPRRGPGKEEGGSVSERFARLGSRRKVHIRGKTRGSTLCNANFESLFGALQEATQADFDRDGCKDCLAARQL